MFSFVGDTVLDPFSGTGTTMLAARKTDRNSIGVEIDPSITKCRKRLEKEAHTPFGTLRFEFIEQQLDSRRMEQS
jgi:modification methylase